MKKSHAVLCFMLLIALVLQAQTVVQVDSIQNHSGQTWVDDLTQILTEELQFTLKLLGRYEIRTESFTPVSDEEISLAQLRNRATTKGYDNIFFGDCSMDEGRFLFTVHVYDHAKGEITYSGETFADNVFDSLNAVREISIKTVEGFSGIHVLYGGLMLSLPSTGEPMELMMDGIPFPLSRLEWPRVPVGTHQLTILQDRPLGMEESSQTFEILEEDKRELPVQPPILSAGEARALEQYEEGIRRALLEGGPLPDKAGTPWETISGSSFFRNYRPVQLDYAKRWESLVLDSDFNSSELSGPMTNLLRVQDVPSQVEDHLVSSLLTKPPEDSRNDMLTAGIKTIDLDGKADDWEDIPDLFQDEHNDLIVGGSFPGADVDQVKVATDGERLYVMVRSTDDSLRVPNRVFQLHVGGNPIILIQFHTSTGDKLAGKFFNSNNYPDWESFAAASRFSAGEVLEVSLPLEMLLKNTEMENSLRLVVESVELSGDWQPLDDIPNNDMQIYLPYLKAFIELQGKN